MYSTGKFTKLVGVERNTMIVWLREGVAVPEETEGRNNVFSHEEVLTLRAIVPLYQDWGIGTDILKLLAQWIRGMLSVRAQLAFDTPEETLRAIAAKRVSNAIDDGHLEAAELLAESAGLSLPENWSDGLDGPDLGDMDWSDLNQYEALVKLASGKGNGWLSLAKAGDEWKWHVEWGEAVSFDPDDSDCFIVVNLRKALAD